MSEVRKILERNKKIKEAVEEHERETKDKGRELPDNILDLFEFYLRQGI